MDLIALTGPAGAGKSTAAAWLARHRGYARVSFAAPLKAMLEAIGIDPAALDRGPAKAAPHPLLCGATPRRAMQTLGTEWGRHLIHPDLWVRLAEAPVCAALDHGGRVVIDDLRFPNEAAMIRRHGGTIIRIERPGALAPSAAGAASHASEHQPITPDLTIRNAGHSPGALHEALADLVREAAKIPQSDQ